MNKNFAAIALAAAVSIASLSTAVSAATMPYTFVEKYEGNDCSGEFGQGFANCAYENSPIVAKFNVGGSTELNTTVFPGITADRFTLVNNGTTGTWSYNGTTGVAISKFVLKAGNAFAVFEMTTPGTLFSDIDWSTALGFLTNKNGKPQGLSHISFYDTDSVPAPVPLPAAGFMLLAAMGGLGFLRRRKAA